jgi:hypothetical protein
MLQPSQSNNHDAPGYPQQDPPHAAGYGGPDRRRRRVYVTRNTEYHFDDRTCVAVRDRDTGHWLLRHPALKRRLSGSIRFSKHLLAYPTLESPRLGEGLFFGDDGPDVVTSNLLSVERPPKNVVGSYPA